MDGEGISNIINSTKNVILFDHEFGSDIKYVILFQSDNKSKDCVRFDPNYISVNNVLLA